MFASLLLAISLEVCQSSRSSPNLVPQPPFFEPEYLPRKQTSNKQTDSYAAFPSNVIEPEYFNVPPQARRYLHSPVVPQVDTTGQETEIAEYVNNPRPTNFLEISTSVVVEQQHAESLFMDAVLTDDLEKEMKNVKPGEKFIHRGVAPALFFGRAKASSKPEAPSYLSKELSGVFQQMAEKYENNFQDHFKGPPHSGSYDERLLANYKVSAEPQILLPVPASLLFEVVSKYREQMQAKKTTPAFVESGSRKSGDIPAGLSLSNYLDPFPSMIPAVVLGQGYVPPPAVPVSSTPPNFPVTGIVSLGVQSPPPPLRPDNLPPPPYISPLVVEKDDMTKSGASTTGAAPTTAK